MPDLRLNMARRVKFAALKLTYNRPLEELQMIACKRRKKGLQYFLAPLGPY